MSTGTHEAPIEVVRRAINIPGATFTATALEIDEGMGEPRLREIGAMLAQIEGSKNWWVGDFICCLQKRKGELYTEEHAEAFGLMPGTVRIYRMVAAFFPAAKRYPDLSFGHHFEALAGAEGSVAAAQAWLKNARKEGWTVAQLRAQVRRSKAEYQPDGNGPTGDGYAAIMDAVRFASQRLKHLDDYTPESARAVLEDMKPILEFAEGLGKLAAVEA